MTNIQRFESSLGTTKQQLAGLLASIDGREATEDERTRINGLIAEAKVTSAALERARNDKSQLDAITGLLEGDGLTPVGPGQARRAATLGAQLTQSDGYRRFREGKNTRPSAWNFSALLDLGATTLTESAGSGGALALPDVRPGIVPGPQPPVVVANLFAPGTTTATAITYLREKTFTNAAAPVLEGGTKPESALVFESVTDPLRKIAHWLPATDEILEDVDQLTAYIDARLRGGVQLVEDHQLLHGTGVAPELLGLLTRTDLAPPLTAGAGESAADAIARQIAAVQTLSQLVCDGVILNPSDYLLMSLVKTSTGEYLSSGPFQAPITPVLWGRSLALSPECPSGTAIVGAFKAAAQLFRHGNGLRVEASNSHQDFFIKNLVAIRAEERLALAVYKPLGIGTVSFVLPAPTV